MLTKEGVPKFLLIHPLFDIYDYIEYLNRLILYRSKK
jgi:hypothetical protein